MDAKKLLSISLSLRSKERISGPRLYNSKINTIIGGEKEPSYQIFQAGQRRYPPTP